MRTFGIPIRSGSRRLLKGANTVDSAPRARCLVLAVSIALLHLMIGAEVAAQSFEITSYTLDGGGGTSTNGQYALSGTVGQPDAGGTLTNGQYSVTGGFWALPQAVQTPGAPLLSIAPAGPGQAEISWNPDDPGWVLQQSELLTNGWSNAPSMSTNPVAVPITPPVRFYRLFNPG